MSKAHSALNIVRALDPAVLGACAQMNLASILGFGKPASISVVLVSIMSYGLRRSSAVEFIPYAIGAHR